jgi:energy-coupling factor transport system ATP-binding protein
VNFSVLPAATAPEVHPAKLLNGLLLPTSGDVFVMGMNTRDEEKLIDIRRNIGMVFQNPDNQMVATIVEEDVAFGPENLGVPQPQLRAIVDDSLAIVGMSEYKDKKPHQLSGGQKQRIAIAGVLAMQPGCIVFDEATAMLDPLGRREVLATIEKLNAQGVTIVMITHYMEELTGADRILVIDGGRCVMEGSPTDIFAREEDMRALRLGVPEIVEIAQALKREGVALKDGILTTDELVDELCRLA